MRGIDADTSVRSSIPDEEETRTTPAEPATQLISLVGVKKLGEREAWTVVDRWCDRRMGTEHA